MRIQNAMTRAKPIAIPVFTTPAPMATTPVALWRATSDAAEPIEDKASFIYVCTVLFWNTSE